MTTLTFITPAEASARSEQNLDQLASEAMFKIDTAIRKQADLGNFTLRFDFRSIGLGSDHSTVVESVKTEIATLGYTVTVDAQFKAGDEVFETILIDWTTLPV